MPKPSQAEHNALGLRLTELDAFMKAEPEFFQKIDQIALNSLSETKKKWVNKPNENYLKLKYQYDLIISQLADDRIRKTELDWNAVRAVIINKYELLLIDLLKANPYTINFQPKGIRPSAFMLAVSHSNHTLVNICLADGKPDLTLIDDMGRAALDIAFGNNFTEPDPYLISLLRSKGAKTAAELKAQPKSAIPTPAMTTSSQQQRPQPRLGLKADLVEQLNDLITRLRDQEGYWRVNVYSRAMKLLNLYQDDSFSTEKNKRVEDLVNYFLTNYRALLLTEDPSKDKDFFSNVDKQINDIVTGSTTPQQQFDPSDKDDIPLLPIISRDTRSSISSQPSSSQEDPKEKTEVAGKKRRDRFFDAVDRSNRLWFEGFFDFFFHPLDTWDAYRYNEDDEAVYYPIALGRYLLGFFARLLLLPLTSLVYNISRISLIELNFKAAYQHNSAKTVLMTTVTVAAAATLLTVGLLTPFFTQYSLQLLSGVATGLGASIGSAIIMGALLSIGLAVLLHSTKKVAQLINADSVTVKAGDDGYTYDPVSVTAPKYLQPYHEGIPPTIRISYNNILHHYYNVQKQPAICGVDSAQQEIKSILNQFQKVRKNRDLSQEDWDKLRGAADQAFTNYPYTDGNEKDGDNYLRAIPKTLDNFEVNQGKVVPHNNNRSPSY